MNGYTFIYSILLLEFYLFRSIFDNHIKFNKFKLTLKYFIVKNRTLLRRDISYPRRLKFETERLKTH